MISRTIVVLGCLAVVAVAPCAADDLLVSHLYELSDFNGPVPYNDAILHADRKHDEVYAVVGGEVRVFNRNGMEIYRFQQETTDGRIMALAVDERGDIFTLKLDREAQGDDRNWWIQRSDYRGELIGRIDVSELPTEIADFVPNRMFLHDGRFVLVSTSGMQVVTVDRSGRFQSRLDLAELLQIEKPDSLEISGFSIDRSGNLLFTIPVHFRAYVVAPDETVRSFGSPGSARGKFGIVAGIVGTDDGHYVVTDKLRRVVMVFDSSFRVVAEFAGSDRRDLARPTALALGNAGKVYVTQTQNRGIAVLGLSTTSDPRTFDSGSTIGNSVVQENGL